MARKTDRKTQKRKGKERRETGRRALSAVFKAFLRLSVAVAVIGIMGFGANAGYEAAVDRRYFDVKEIEITGLKHLKKETIQKLMGPVAGRNTFEVDLEKMGRGVERHPWIARVEIRRELPSRLVVRVTERRPVAIADLGSPWLIDKDGVLLKKVDDADHHRKDLPELKGLEPPSEGIKPGAVASPAGVAVALEAMKNLEGYRLFGRSSIRGVDLSRPDRLEFFFAGSDTRIITPEGWWTDEVERLRVVDYLLRKEKREIESINLIFTNKVIVTYPKASGRGGGSRHVQG